MKFRNGFVSNSSSSSFILITDHQSHKQTLEAMRKKKDGNRHADLIDHAVGRKTLNIGEVHHMHVEIVVLHTGSGEMFYYGDPIFNWNDMDILPANDGDDKVDWSNLLLDEDLALLDKISDEDEKEETRQEILAEIEDELDSAIRVYEETIKKLELPHISQDMNL